MSKLNQFREIERKIAEQMEMLEALKKDEGFQKDQEFESMLKELMEEYEISVSRLIAIIAPDLSTTSTQQPTQRKPRATKIYTNPHNGQIIETKGGNHKGLKAWKEEYGADEVESWVVIA